MDDVRKQLQEQKQRLETISQKIDTNHLQQQTRELEAQTMKEGFWDNQENARKVTQQLANKQKQLITLEKLESRIQNALDVSQEEEMFEDLNKEVAQLNGVLDDLELKLFLSNPHDESEAIISVHAGAGGVEAMDWAAMLARMYQRFFDRQSWEYEITDESIGEEAGYKSISMIVHEPFAFGFLKGEKGTHRLVRQSPFNADNLRQTSFALVEVLPVIEDTGEVAINPEDIEFEAFRSGGHGGQNVNKVSTAVRIKHVPTGITVTAQTERSQLQNRENAMKLLVAKLWALQQEQEKQEIDKLRGETTQASWGTQIRSYVLHPYKMVKDLRTGIETSQAEAVLDGDLEEFIKAEVFSTSNP